MQFLGDAGISPRTIEFLKHLGHSATHVRDLGLQGANDVAVNQRLATVLTERLSDLESGALILVEDARYRVRRLPITPA
jgi:hypothetical protein